MKGLYKKLTQNTSSLIMATYILTLSMLLLPPPWWIPRVACITLEAFIMFVLIVGAKRRWPRGDKEENVPIAVTASTEKLKTLDLAGDEMSTSEAIKVLERGDWIKLLRDDKSQDAWDVRCELFDAQDIAVEAMKRELGRWVPITERSPTSLDANADGCVLAIHKTSNKRYYHWRTIAETPFAFRFWMKVPNDL